MKSACTSCGGLFKFLPAIVAAVGGCAVNGSYPANWPEDDGKQIGKCPQIAGTYSNVGVRHPPEGVPLSLTQVLGLKDGDRVVIDQSPDTIRAAALTSGQTVDTVVFRSGEISFYGLTGWDTSQPRRYSCVLNLPDLQRRLSFSHLMRSSVGGVGGFGAGVIGASGEGVHFTKGTDGSLVLHFSKDWGALLGVVPVGTSQQFWIKFAPASQ